MEWDTAAGARRSWKRREGEFTGLDGGVFRYGKNCEEKLLNPGFIARGVFELASCMS